VAVDQALKAASTQRRIQLVGELQIVAAVGDEDAKLALHLGSDADETYEFLWSHEREQGFDDGEKRRPALILSVDRLDQLRTIVNFEYRCSAGTGFL
jgi:hypothetical protein